MCTKEDDGTVRCRLPPHQAENIETLTLRNTDYRRVHRTHAFAQVVFMSLEPGEYIPWESHTESDQFIRVEQGKAMVRIQQEFRPTAFNRVTVREDEFIVIDAGVKHYIENPEPATALKMYVLYMGQPEHAKGTLQVRQGGEIFYTEEEETTYSHTLSI